MLQVDQAFVIPLLLWECTALLLRNKSTRLKPPPPTLKYLFLMCQVLFFFNHIALSPVPTEYFNKVMVQIFSFFFFYSSDIRIQS